jgi:flagellar hook assembly protein FlgD
MRPQSELKVPALTAALPQKPIVVEVSKNTGALPPPPIQLPQKWGADSVEGNRLSVVVELEKLAQVQVRVLNPQDQALRVLFDGPLSPGKWSIQWDGRLADGTQAESGKYLIQVKAGSQVMSKSVSVEPSK